jgi:hypothetical protein
MAKCANIGEILAHNNLAIETGVIGVYPSLLLSTSLDPFFFCDFLSSHSCIDNVMGKKARSTWRAPNQVNNKRRKQNVNQMRNATRPYDLLTIKPRWGFMHLAQIVPSDSNLRNNWPTHLGLVVCLV